MRTINIFGIGSVLALSGAVLAACGSGGTDAADGSATAGPTGTGGTHSAGAGGSHKGGTSGAAGTAGHAAGSGGTAGLLGGGGTAGQATGGTSSAGTGGTHAAGAGGSTGGASTAGTGGVANPQGGSSSQTCSSTQKDCDMNTANGCESNTTIDPMNCGGCGTVCGGAMNADGACVDSACVVICQAGWAACTGTPADGCGTQIGQDPTNCGLCGHACSDETNGTASCISGKCSLACAPDYQDCDGSLATGCESHAPDDDMNCGQCGMACTGPCNNGACTCAGTSASAKPVPLDIYIMLDKSGSMNEAQMGSTRWQVVTGALTSFFNDPSTAGTRIALQYFPLSGPTGTACQTEDYYYYTPAVPMSLIPGSNNAQITALDSSMMSTMPVGGTPTDVALTGALQYASDWKKALVNDAVIVVLATDGQPGDDCNSTIDTASAAAAAGFMASPSIPTYVIGVGPDQGNLDALAMSGGTSTAFVVNDGDATAFIAALKSIKNKALGCSYAIPTSTTGSLDFTKVNVQYTPGGGTPGLLDGVATAADCGASGGWYYDNPAMPTQIILCDSTCSTIQADPSATIDIILGCATKKDLTRY